MVALFAVGLPGFSIYLLLMRAYQAMQDTMPMFWLYAVENGVTIVLALTLYPVLGVRGLAVGWVGGYSLATIAALAHLSRRIGGFEGRAVAGACVRIGAASAVMAAVVTVILNVGGGPSGLTALRIVMAVGLGAVVYFVVGRRLGIGELGDLTNLRRRSL
jgi:putative peptidoglycan lipid II flippase